MGRGERREKRGEGRGEHTSAKKIGKTQARSTRWTAQSARVIKENHVESPCMFGCAAGVLGEVVWLY